MKKYDRVIFYRKLNGNQNLRLRIEINKALILVVSFFTVFVGNLAAQEVVPERFGFKSYSVRDKSLGEINYHISSNRIDESKPVLLYLDGSGASPLFQYIEKAIVSTVPLDINKLSNNYHIVLVSKPGIPFVDSVRTRTQGEPAYVPAEYKEKLSLDWRVNSAKTVLKQVMKKVKVNKKKVVAFGISEGFQVGAKLATIDKNITHLVLFVGSGLNQFYDFIVHNRTDAQKGVISETEAQKNIDSLMYVAKEISSNPHATDRGWYGHTYLRWSSFTRENTTENILSLNIPIYIVAATNDRNSSILGTDYLYLESIRRGKANLQYRVYPYDHFFNERIKDEEGKILPSKNHMQDVMAEALEWIEKN